MKNNKNTLITVALVALSAIALIWLGRPAETGGNPAPAGALIETAFSAREYSYDFGEISMARGKVSRVFSVENTGAEPVMITKVYTSCMCTSAYLEVGGDRVGPFGMPGHGFIPNINKLVGPGEEAKVEAVFDPAAHGPAGVGRIERVIRLENDMGAPLELKISANVIP